MPNPLGKFLPLKMTVNLALLLLSYLILPVYLTQIIGGEYFKFIFLFYALNLIILALIFKKNSAQKYHFDSRIQGLREKTNLLNEQYSREYKNSIALEEKAWRYASLEKILEKMNQSLDLDVVAETLSGEAFSLIAHNLGVCILYLVDDQTQRLALFKAKKENPELVIKAKEGNIFDFWVLKHASPLLIEDTKNDFRFDLEKLKNQDNRLVGSLISAPFVSENKLLGIVRLDNTSAHFFSQDDLRFLGSISDLGALALENSELFKKTQDLAIHDALTSLYTKGYFRERLREEFRRCSRQNIPLSLLMLDIDLFKNYNDRFGHTAGDLVLKRVSHMLGESLANFNAIISRFGGEEFCVIISGMDKKSAHGVAESLRQAVEKEKILLRRKENHISISIGVASFPADALDEDDLIRRADKAMYSAKQKGRNRVCSI